MSLNFFSLKVKVFNVPTVARTCCIVPQQDLSVDDTYLLLVCRTIDLIAVPPLYSKLA